MVTMIASCKEKSLPLPEVSEGMRGQLGIDKNINEATIDKYLGRSDSVYRDMRMLKDEANYEAIGGDSYLSGYVKGFEVVPYPYICNVEGLPEEVGESYIGETLFTHTEDDEYIANYEESMHILESLFPKDKYIFLMCGGGGYSGMMKDLLVALGWDGDRIYNTGGYWYYDGKNKVETTYEENGETHYDFSSLIYHNIDFSLLTKINDPRKDDDKKGADYSIFEHIDNVEELNELENNKETFAVYVYLPGCVSCATFYPIVKEFTESNQIRMYALVLSNFAKSSNSISDRVSYSPSMFIYKDGEVVAYLDPGSNDDLVYYETLEGLTTWFSKYIDIEILRSETKADYSDCESACGITD
ncbi:MAG: hypothetical protein J6S38_08520 [Erysipelotrichaceae bacterium]|nr:hypothetical protein [Erysipelotrichaceae bacterium]MBP5280466.1 hypothetical protein [Erysipelotrichaceae bacterium]